MGAGVAPGRTPRSPGPGRPLGAKGRRRGADQLLLSPCSMNVQGDYEPIDATGFININALR